MKRRQLILGLAGSTLLSPLVALKTALAAGTGPRPPGLQDFSGEVRINGQPARKHMPLRAGDEIVTGQNAHAIYIVGQDAYLLRGGSHVVINEAASSRLVLRIVQGKILSVFGKGDKTLHTPIATIGIRGTACYIEAETTKVYFCLCYGRAEVRSSSNPALLEIVETQYHDRPMYLNGSDMPFIEPAPVINHTDAELIMLEKLVGRVPPFVGKANLIY